LNNSTNNSALIKSNNIDTVKNSCCYYTNARSILNKKEELQQIIKSYQPFIIGLTETWLKSDVLDNELDYDLYNIFRHDRDESMGGGVMLMIDKNWPALESVDITENNYFKDMIWCQITVNNNESLLVGCLYRTPSSGDNENQLLKEVLCSVTDIKCDHILITGDFNLPNIDWLKNVASCGEKAVDSQMLKAFNDCFLTQHVSFATRDLLRQQRATLDLVFTREEGLVNCVSHLGKSDHCGILIQLCVSAKQSQINESVLVHDWAKADFPEMSNEILSIDWINKLDIMNADEINTCLSDFLQQLVEKHVPKRILKKNC